MTAGVGSARSSRLTPEPGGNEEMKKLCSTAAVTEPGSSKLPACWVQSTPCQFVILIISLDLQ